MAFETVFTVWDYYDGPRSGLASFSGKPHHYSCEWDEVAGSYSDDVFTLSPIDQETFLLVMEQESIWQQWEAAFHRGEVQVSTHPGNPGSNPYYAELQREIERRLARPPGLSERKHGSFRALPGQESKPVGRMRELEVEWREPISC